MPRTLVTLVSPQALPAVLFIKQFGPFDRYIFLSTELMEQNQVTSNIVNTCKLKKNVEVVEIDADRMFDVMDAVDMIKFQPGEKITINLTGGTKMMALGIYNFFTEVKSSSLNIFYIPFPSSLLYKIYPSNEKIQLTSQVTLHEYLQAYGVRIVDEEKLSTYEDKIGFCNDLFSERCHGKVPHQILNSIHPDYKNEDKKLLSGGWFEIWLGHRIKSYFNLEEEEIRINMKLSRAPESSIEYTEYDVVYIKNNKLYIAECKYFPTGKFTKSKINKDWYKLAGLKLQLGLNATPFLITANKLNGDLREYLDDTYRLFEIKGFADITTIGEEPKFNEFLNQL